MIWLKGLAVSPTCWAVNAVAVAAPGGSWLSPLTARAVVAGAVSPGEVEVHAGQVWWSESRPDEGGRSVVVCDGVDAVGPETNVRTAVHEYGGGAWTVVAGRLIFSEFSDQRLYRQEADGSLTVLTPEPEQSRGLRYADGCPTPDGRWLVCVRERHGVSLLEPANEVVAVALDGTQEVRVLVEGPDFVSNPRVSPDGSQLCWVQWDHPDLPWDNTELWLADFDDGVLSNQRLVAAEGESFFQPAWSPNGILHVVTDRDNWWHLYRVEGDGLQQLTFGDLEVATPQWVFGLSRYAFVGDEVWLAFTQEGTDHLGVLSADGQLRRVETSATSINSLAAYSEGVVAVLASFGEEPAVTVVTGTESQTLSVRRDLGLDSSWFPQPEMVTFASSNNEVAHALVYPPTNPNFEAEEGQAPPLMVLAHGGPTGAARTQLQLSITYWTSRGFCVADVNYRGSTGYGRVFRHRLWGNWGVLDVDDCLAVAQHLVAQGKADGGRLAIKGGSAGGFTVLAAVTFHDVFSAGASRYGVADLAALAADTHKFEARYLDRLVGRWPEDELVYAQRSPINHLDRLATPMLLLQGSLDKIVPPNQAHLMAEGLRQRGVPFALLEFADEGHGFRKAENQVRALEAELSFFADQFGFVAADDLPPLNIEC